MTISQFFVLYGVCGLIWFVGGFYALILHFHGAFSGKRVAVTSTSPALATHIANQVKTLAEKLRMYPDLFTTQQLWLRIVRYSVPGLLLQGLLWFIPVFNLIFRKRYTVYIEEIK